MRRRAVVLGSIWLDNRESFPGMLACVNDTGLYFTYLKNEVTPPICSLTGQEGTFMFEICFLIWVNGANS